MFGIQFSQQGNTCYAQCFGKYSGACSPENTNRGQPFLAKH